jgi:hypothetical protein
MQNRELLRDCIAAQVLGMDFQKVYRLVIKPSGLWNGSAPVSERMDGTTVQQVELIDGSQLVFDPKAEEWHHEPP